MSEEISDTSEAEITDSTEAEVSEDESTYEGSEEAVESVEESTEEVAEEPAPRMFKTIINGREEIVSEEDMIRGYQTRKASSEAFRQASEERKAAEAIKSNMRNKPIQAFLDQGMSMEEVKEMFYSETKNFLDLSEETEEQRGAREQHEELVALRQEKLDREEAMKSDNEKAESAKFETEIESEFTAALETGNIPSSPGAISRIAQIQLMNLNDGYDLTVAEAAEIYQDERREDVNTMFDGMTTEQMMQWVGSERMDAVRKHDLNRIRKKPSAPKEEVVKKEKGPPVSMKSFFN